PLRSTRFPYTTLFRSTARVRLAAIEGVLLAVNGRPVARESAAARGAAEQAAAEQGAVAAVLRGRLRRALAILHRPEERPRDERGDRKSTRLNSSHEWI